VANINSLTVFDTVYSAVRGKPFGAGSVGREEAPRTESSNKR
jgi:hypothetical protein